MNLLKKTKKEYFNYIDVKDLNDNKSFWKTIKPFFPDKGINSNKLMLIENDRIITEESDLSEVINNYLTNIIDKFELKHDVLSNINLDLTGTFVTYEDHLSVNRIREHFDKSCFHFATVSQQEVKTVIQNLSNNKANLLGDIPSKTLKLSLDCYLPELTKIINNCFENGDFPNELKL